MEKLIELLNEREKELSPNAQVEWTKFSVGINKWYLISKECGFIKRLVENDKIDFYTILKENGTFRKEFYAIENRKEYERLLMMLAIQDNPIEFLISILK